MKNKHLYSLLDNGFTTIRVNFTAEIQQPSRAKAPAPPRAPSYEEGAHSWNPLADESGYIYKVRLADNVKVGDQCVVYTNRRLAIVSVSAVHDTPQIDVDADFDYKWIVQRIDLEKYQSEVDRERNFNETMLQVERVKQRDQLVESFRNSLPEGSAARALFEQTASQLTPPAPVQPVAPQAPSAPVADQ